MKSQPNGLIIDDMMIFTKYEKASITDRNVFNNNNIYILINSGFFQLIKV